MERRARVKFTGDCVALFSQRSRERAAAPSVNREKPHVFIIAYGVSRSQRRIAPPFLRMPINPGFFVLSRTIGRSPIKLGKSLQPSGLKPGVERFSEIAKRDEYRESSPKNAINRCLEYPGVHLHPVTYINRRRIAMRNRKGSSCTRSPIAIPFPLPST